MKVHTYYERALKSWVAFLSDENGGKIGGVTFGGSKEDAVFQLGLAYGRNPSKFAQPLSELVGEPMTQPVN